MRSSKHSRLRLDLQVRQLDLFSEDALRRGGCLGDAAGAGGWPVGLPFQNQFGVRVADAVRRLSGSPSASGSAK